VTAVLVGMNNPVSSDPAHALYPHPPGCTGHRLFSMLCAVRPATTRRDYLALRRVNVLGQKRWSAGEARAAAYALRNSLLTEAHSEPEGSLTVVVFGQDAWRALLLPEHVPLVLPYREGRVVWRRVPHPSGRNHWYNEPGNRVVVGLLLAELLDG